MLNLKYTILVLFIALSFCDFHVPLCNKTSLLRKIYSNPDQLNATANINYFVYATDGSQAYPSTNVKLCHDGKFLYVNASMVDTDIVSTLSGCNSNLFTEDVFEMFIATTASYPYQYFEIEVSPRGELFFADIYNPQLTCANLGTKYQQCDKLSYGAKINEAGWESWLKLNLTIIGRGKAQKQFLTNMFRIDKNYGYSTKYECWKSTLANPACFHKPAVFEKIILQ